MISVVIVFEVELMGKSICRVGIMGEPTKNGMVLVIFGLGSGLMMPQMDWIFSCIIIIISDTKMGYWICVVWVQNWGWGWGEG